MRPMFAQFEFPETITPHDLDRYLEQGWFRMHQTIFTTHFLCFNQRFYSAVWLRVGLAAYVTGKKQKELYRRNSHLHVVIHKAVITPEHEELYGIYRRSISFSVSESLQDLLLANEERNRYNTYTVSLYDGDKLVAAGIFDLGATAAAGISCFYHPDYKKQSLGRYLMYLKIDFCRKRGLKYFYPGYVVPGYAAFDYKMNIGTATLEYLALDSNSWLPFSGFSAAPEPLPTMYAKLVILQAALRQKNIQVTLHYYRFFDANLDTFYAGIGLFDYPVFLYCHPVSEAVGFKMLVFDVRDNRYHLIPCRSLFSVATYNPAEQIFSADLLQAGPPLLDGTWPEEIAGKLAGYL